MWADAIAREDYDLDYDYTPEQRGRVAAKFAERVAYLERIGPRYRRDWWALSGLKKPPPGIYLRKLSSALDLSEDATTVEA